MRRLLLRLSDRLPVREICEEGRPYLERYFLLHLFGIRVYLHRFVGSDPERGLHDHPWRWAFSLVLSGWYIEHRRDGRRIRRIGNLLSGDTFHRVVLPEGMRECWTLFVHSAPDVKRWGFLSPSENIDAEVWLPFQYASGKNSRWEMSAPTGRELRSIQREAA
jgi:hypothetical protein